MQNVPNPGNYTANIGQLVTSFRDDYQRILNANSYLNANGGAAFLEAAPFNFSPDDAAAWVAALGNLASISGIATAIANSEPIWGGN
jgi:hypothetical protein